MDNKLINKDAKPRLDFVKKDQRLEALTNKLVTPSVTTAAYKGIDIPNIYDYGSISQKIGRAINDTDAMFQLLPDLNLTEMILVSSILAPKDYIHSDLTFKVNNDDIDIELSAPMLKVIEDHFTKIYKIKDMLPKMLSDALFRKGAYPLAILPENAIDAVINSTKRASMEDINVEFNRHGQPAPLGLLGVRGSGKRNERASLESLASPLGTQRQTFKDADWRINAYTTVTDNFNILKMPKLRDKLTHDRARDIISLAGINKVSTENNSNNSPELSYYRPRLYTQQPTIHIKPASAYDKPTVGHPMVMRWPVESIIPVHRPGSPEEHIAYILLIDQYGNPVVKESSMEYYDQLGSSMNSDQDSGVSQLLKNTYTAVHGVSGVGNWGHDKIVDPTATYASIIESDLRERLRAGIWGDSVEISRPDDVYRICLARALAKQHTQLLCIPAELMTYIAFDYNEDGTGRSMVDSSKILGSIRAVLLFADTMAAVNNSTPKTRLNIQLDPQDTNPSQTVTFLLNESAKTKQSGYPVGVSNPTDIVSFLQASSTIVNVTGNTGYPETKVDTEDYQSNRARPDTQLQDDIRKRHNQHFGITPEVIDQSMQGDLATTVVNSNILFAKRVLMWQNTFCMFLAEHIKQYTINSSTLLDSLREIISANKSKLPKELKHGNGEEQAAASIESYLINFIRDISVSLPQPDTTALKSQVEQLDQYKQLLDSAITAYIDGGFLDSSVLGNSANSIEMIIASIKAYYIRRYMREENIMPELAELVTFDEKSGPAMNLLDEHTAHVDALRKSLDGFIEHFAKTVTPSEEPPATDGTGMDADTSGTVDGTGMGMDDELGAGDDMSIDSNVAGDVTEDDVTAEPPAEEPTKPETESTNTGTEPATEKPTEDADKADGEKKPEEDNPTA